MGQLPIVLEPPATLRASNLTGAAFLSLVLNGACGVLIKYARRGARGDNGYCFQTRCQTPSPCLAESMDRTIALATALPPWLVTSGN